MDQFRTLAKFANCVIASTLMGCMLIVPYCVRAYGWHPDRYMLNPLSTVLYYILAITTFFLLAALRLETRHRISLSIFLIALAAGAYGMEIPLALSKANVNDAERVAAARQMGVAFDGRDRLEVIAELETEHRHAVPNVNPANFLTSASEGDTRRSKIKINGVETLPLAGISKSLTVFCNESGQYITYESDEYGFNNPQGLWKAPHFDIAAVGDSFTQGSCVPPDRNIVAWVRKRYPVTTNLGIVNDGPLTEFATLKEYLPALKPRVVLWFYYEGNDLEDLDLEKRTPLLTKYLQPNFTQGLATQQTNIDFALNAAIGVSRNELQQVRRLNSPPIVQRLTPILRLEHLRQRIGLSSGTHREHPDVGLNLPLFNQILSEAKDLVSTWDGKLYFIYLPEWLRYAYPNAASAYRDAVLTMVNSLDIPVIDIHRVFQSKGDPLMFFPFRINGHYNEQGYKLVADEVISTLNVDRNENLVAVRVSPRRDQRRTLE